MRKRVGLDPKTGSKSQPMTSAPGRLTLIGQPQLLEGEDAAAYDELLARIRAAVTPADIIDEMFIIDVASLEWEVLRWRRLKSNLMRARGLKALTNFLVGKLEYHLYSEQFAEDLAKILQDNFPRDKVEAAQMLAHACARNEKDAVDMVNKILDRNDLYMESILNKTQARRAEELVQKYVRREPDAVMLIHELLTRAGVDMDTFMADAIANQLDDIERIDRLTAIAESRRNASLREIDRRRAVLGETLRRSVQEVEDAEFEVIEMTPAKEKMRLDEPAPDQI
jgi:hypothetical protein